MVGGVPSTNNPYRATVVCTRETRDICLGGGGAGHWELEGVSGISSKQVGTVNSPKTVSEREDLAHRIEAQPARQSMGST